MSVELTLPAVVIHWATGDQRWTLTVPGELVAPGLAITPAIQFLNDNRGVTYSGDFQIVHTASGDVVGYSACLPCVRYGAGMLARAGVDWTADVNQVMANPVGREAVTAWSSASLSCQSSGCDR